MDCLIAWVEREDCTGTLTYYEGQHVLGGTHLVEEITALTDQDEVDEMGLDPDILPLIDPIVGNTVVACVKL